LRGRIGTRRRRRRPARTREKLDRSVRIHRARRRYRRKHVRAAFDEVSEGRRMNPRITVITLGVDDLERAVRFYSEGLGFPTEGIVGREFEHGAVAFLDMQPGLRLALWPRTSLAHDSGLAASGPSPADLFLGH